MIGESMLNSRPNGMPAYKKIQGAIIKRIESGQLKPGDTVDSERELAKIHKVSLMTARHALTALEREGLVQRRRGAGTFVAPPKIHFNKLTSFTEQMAGRSLTACSKVLSFGIVDNEQEVAARLALATDTRLLKVERLRIAADEPFALFSIIEGTYGIQLAYADEEMDATAAAPATANLLQVPRDEPLLRIRQLIYSTKGKAALYVLGLYRSDRHTLLVRRFR